MSMPRDPPGRKGRLVEETRYRDRTIRRAVRMVNAIHLAARVHRHAEARRFFDALLRSLVVTTSGPSRLEYVGRN